MRLQLGKQRPFVDAIAQVQGDRLTHQKVQTEREGAPESSSLAARIGAATDSSPTLLPPPNCATRR